MDGGNVARPSDVLELCESGFERSFAKRLIDLNYRLVPQVPVGDYRIDFVVEGDNDRRLAIELDGDKYHGPERWADDMRRQNALERLGWIFWRCWGSHWISDPEGCLADLKTTLDQLGIEPIGMAVVPGVYTEHIRREAPAGAETESISETPAESDVVAPAPPSPAKPIPVRDVKAAPVTRPTPAIPPMSVIKPRPIIRLPSAPAGAKSPSRNSAETEIDLISFMQQPPKSAPVSSDLNRKGDDRDAGQVEVGDLVVIRFNDAPNKPLRVRLSRSENCPSEGIVHKDEPLGAAVLGASIEDEVEVRVGGRVRTAVIEKIEKKQAGLVDAR